MAQDFLPDSRTKRPTGSRPSALGNAIPIYCFHCHKLEGYVSEAHCTFAAFLCDGCAETHGHIAGLRAEPDAVFWERVQNAQLEATKGMAVLSDAEILRRLHDPSSDFSKLAADWSRRLEKGHG